MFLSDINSRFTLQHRYIPDRESFAKLVQIFKKHVKKKVEPSIEAVASGASTGNDQLTSGFHRSLHSKVALVSGGSCNCVRLSLSLQHSISNTHKQTTQQVRSGRTREDSFGQLAWPDEHIPRPQRSPRPLMKKKSSRPLSHYRMSGVRSEVCPR